MLAIVQRNSADTFAAAVADSPAEYQPALSRLLEWALDLEKDGLAVLYTSVGKGRWVLNPRLPGQERGMVMIWNDNGASLSPYRTVLSQEAPRALSALDAKAPGQIGQATTSESTTTTRCSTSFALHTARPPTGKPEARDDGTWERVREAVGRESAIGAIGPAA